MNKIKYVKRKTGIDLILGESPPNGSISALNLGAKHVIIVEALDMVVAFKEDSKKPTRSRGNNRTRSTRPNDNSKQGDRKRKEE
eukprot:jgi/Psemu1/15766/gm1.15766_g